eukprot:345855-Pleurochrysis_carterae.AAC.2
MRAGVIMRLGVLSQKRTCTARLFIVYAFVSTQGCPLARAHVPQHALRQPCMRAYECAHEN